MLSLRTLLVELGYTVTYDKTKGGYYCLHCHKPVGETEDEARAHHAEYHSDGDAEGLSEDNNDWRRKMKYAGGDGAVLRILDTAMGYPTDSHSEREIRQDGSAHLPDGWPVKDEKEVRAALKELERRGWKLITTDKGLALYPPGAKHE